MIPTRHLYLRLQDHKATLVDSANLKQVRRSRGTWRTEGMTVIVEVSGSAGQYEARLQLLSMGSENLLAPYPPELAVLKDCWMTNQEDDDHSPLEW